MTIDEVKWLEGAGQFLLALHNRDFFQTYWHFFPGITITWGGAMILWLQYLFSDSMDLPTFITDQMADLSQIIGLMRLSGVIITSLSVVGVYWLARPLVGKLAAFLGAALLAVDPFFVAHSRIVNGDAAAAILMFLAVLAFANLWQMQTFRWALLAGVLAGLALLTKLPSPLILPWIGVMAVIGFGSCRNWQFWLKAVLISGIVAAITFVLLFPAMWVSPLETLRLMFAESFNVGEVGAGHDTFFLSEISEDPGWGFYPVAIAYRLTPLVMVGIGSILVWLWLGKTNRQTHPQVFRLVLSLVGYIVFVYVFASISPKKLDRYLMPVIPPLILLAGVGWTWLITVFPRRMGAQQWLSPVLILVLIVTQAWFVVGNYPYVLTYYNPLMGGYSRAVTQVPVGWGEGLEQAAAWLNAQPDAANLTVSSWYSDMVRPYLHTQTASFSSNGTGQLAADYVIFYINQYQRSKPNSAVVIYFTQKEPVFQVDYRGTPYVWVYAAPHVQPVSGSPKIEGRAQLLGYRWNPASPSQPGDSRKLSLFFHTLGNLPVNETFDIAVMSPDGTLWGEWEPGKIDTWAMDKLVEWRGTLTLPNDLFPGDYELVVRLMDTTIDSEVTRFALEDTFVNISR